MATTRLDSPERPWARAAAIARGGDVGALILAGAVPLLFLHERFQPTLEVSAGSTSLDLRVSDAAVLAVVAAALAAGMRGGFERLRAGLLLWIPGALLLVWLALEVARPASVDDSRFADHLVACAKFGEYAALAAAVPLLVRRSRDLAIFGVAVVGWSTVATTVALVQLLGADIFQVTTSGWRYSSFLGRHDLAALCILATSLAAARIVMGRKRSVPQALFVVALVAGTLGVVLAGSVTAAGGFVVGAALLALAGRRFEPSGRQLLALASLVAVIGAGVVTIRSEALDDFLRFVGIRQAQEDLGVESYSQRTVLAYIGLRIAADNPIVGVGWQRSGRAEVFEPYIEDARARFPDVAELAFPAPGREWGIQNLYIQMLADAGVVGLSLLLAVGYAGLTLAWRTARRAPAPWAAGAGLAAICAILALAGTWASLGIVAGIPLLAATCLTLGLTAAGAAIVKDGAAA